MVVQCNSKIQMEVRLEEKVADSRSGPWTYIIENLDSTYFLRMNKVGEQDSLKTPYALTVSHERQLKNTLKKSCLTKYLHVLSLGCFFSSVSPS